MMTPEIGLMQAGETTELFFEKAHKIFDNWYEGEKDLLDYPEVLKVLMQMQQRDFEHSVKIKMIEFPPR